MVTQHKKIYPLLLCLLIKPLLAALPKQESHSCQHLEGKEFVKIKFRPRKKVENIKTVYIGQHVTNLTLEEYFQEVFPDNKEWDGNHSGGPEEEGEVSVWGFKRSFNFFKKSQNVPFLRFKWFVTTQEAERYYNHFPTEEQHLKDNPLIEWFHGNHWDNGQLYNYGESSIFTKVKYNQIPKGEIILFSYLHSSNVWECIKLEAGSECKLCEFILQKKKKIGQKQKEPVNNELNKAKPTSNKSSVGGSQLKIGFNEEKQKPDSDVQSHQNAVKKGAPKQKNERIEALEQENKSIKAALNRQTKINKQQHQAEIEMKKQIHGLQGKLTRSNEEIEAQLNQLQTSEEQHQRQYQMKAELRQTQEALTQKIEALTQKNERIKTELDQQRATNEQQLQEKAELRQTQEALKKENESIKKALNQQTQINKQQLQDKAEIEKQLKQKQEALKEGIETKKHQTSVSKSLFIAGVVVITLLGGYYLYNNAKAKKKGPNQHNPKKL